MRPIIKNSLCELGLAITALSKLKGDDGRGLARHRNRGEGSEVELRGTPSI